MDYKAGAPKPGEDATGVADMKQLGLQALILRDNGYSCTEGIIYYRATKQRSSPWRSPPNYKTGFSRTSPRRGAGHDSGSAVSEHAGSPRGLQR